LPGSQRARLKKRLHSRRRYKPDHLSGERPGGAPSFKSRWLSRPSAKPGCGTREVRLLARPRQVRTEAGRGLISPDLARGREALLFVPREYRARGTRASHLVFREKVAFRGRGSYTGFSAAPFPLFSSIQKVLPWPGTELTPLRPPRRSIDFWTIASPTPVPGN
jgi:hypothetical protein